MRKSENKRPAEGHALFWSRAVYGENGRCARDGISNEDRALLVECRRFSCAGNDDYFSAKCPEEMTAFGTIDIRTDLQADAGVEGFEDRWK